MMHKLLLSAGIAVTLTGCITAAVTGAVAGAGYLGYKSGNAVFVETQAVKEVFEASRKALLYLEYKITSSKSDKTSGELIARDSSDTKVKLYLEVTESGGTKLTIRIGLLGDESRSKFIHKQIKTYLD